MTPPLIAAFYVGLNALVLIWLTTEVILRRRKGRIGLGDGGDKDLLKAMRGHGNATETMPIFLLMLALTEMIGAPGFAVHLAGAVFTIARIVHGLHFTRRAPHQFRVVGMATSLALSLVLALGLVVHALSGLLGA